MLPGPEPLFELSPLAACFHMRFNFGPYPIWSVLAPVGPSTREGAHEDVNIDLRTEPVGTLSRISPGLDED